MLRHSIEFPCHQATWLHRIRAGAWYQNQKSVHLAYGKILMYMYDIPFCSLSSLVKDANSLNSMWCLTWMFCNYLTAISYFHAVAQLIVMMRKYQFQCDLEDSYSQRITQHGKFCCFYSQNFNRVISLKM